MTLPIVIVGAGQGGLQVAESLRISKYEGDIILLGEEPHIPYYRPPLSKAFLLGECTQEQLVIRKPILYEKRNIQLRTEVCVKKINTKSRKIYCTDNNKDVEIEYKKLVIATGSRARIPPITNVAAKGIHSIRTLDDTLAISEEIKSIKNVVIIGGGFIGLEMAAVARKLGKTVTVVEFADRLMARVVSPQISEYYKNLHEQHGCNIILNTGANEIVEDSSGHVASVILSTGITIPAEMVVLGVGVAPNQELAQDAGLDCDIGVIIDANGITSDPDIYALGDCTAQRLEDGSLRRLESVQNAVELAKSVAASIVGQEKPFVAAPWFWSEQYDIKMQMVGLSQGHDQLVLRGDDTTASFSYFYFKNKKLICIDSLNKPADHMIGRRLLSIDNNLTPEQAQDEGFSLKECL